MSERKSLSLGDGILAALEKDPEAFGGEIAEELNVEKLREQVESSHKHERKYKDYIPSPDRANDNDYRENSSKAEQATHSFLQPFYKEMVERGIISNALSTPEVKDQLAGSDIKFGTVDENGTPSVIVVDEKAKASQLGNEEKGRRPTNTFSFELRTSKKGYEFDGTNEDARTDGSFTKLSPDENYRDPDVKTDYIACISFNDVNCKYASELEKDNINKVTVMFVKPDEIYKWLEEHDVDTEKLYNGALEKEQEFISFYKEHKNDPEFQKEIEAKRRASIDGHDIKYFDRRANQDRESAYYYFGFGKGENKDPNKATPGEYINLVVTSRTLMQLPSTRVFEYDIRQEEPFHEQSILVKGGIEKEKLPFTKRAEEPELNVGTMKKDAMENAGNMTTATAREDIKKDAI